MNIVITSFEKEGYLLIKSAGTLQTNEDLFAHAGMVYEKSLKYRHKKILLEMTATSFPKTIFSYLELVKFYQDNLPIEILSFKIASVVLPEYRELGNFWETAAVNRGFQYYIFTSFEEAEAFLLQ
ncbi:hypothetical protein BH11BAC4_BH11BAC4_26700 [soil metagenome]